MACLIAHGDIAEKSAYSNATVAATVSHRPYPRQYLISLLTGFVCCLAGSVMGASAFVLLQRRLVVPFNQDIFNQSCRLNVVKMGEVPSTVQQFVISSLLDDASAVQYQDPVRYPEPSIPCESRLEWICPWEILASAS